MRVRIMLGLLLALTACSGSSTPAAPSPAASGTSAPATAAAPVTPSPAPSSTPPARSVLLASGGAVDDLAVYAVKTGSHAAVLVRRLAGPAGMHVMFVSLSGGPAPAVCALWVVEPGDDRPSELRCYRAGATQGRTVARGIYGSVSVRADGHALAWTEQTSNSVLVVADLDGDVAKVRSRQRYAAGQPPDGGVPASIEDVDWLGPRTVAGTDVADSDEGRGVCVIDVEAPRRRDAFGYGSCVHPNSAEGDKGFARFEHAAAVGPGEIVTVERSMGCCFDEDPTAPAARAVRIRLADGALLGVVATPRAGRDVIDVSGGPRAVGYVTYGAKDDSRIASLRWAGEAHGAPITGLRGNLQVVAVQP